MIRTSNSKIIKKAELIAKALEDDTEEILLHAERLVKAALKPTDQVKALRMIEKKMSNEGVEVAFQKKVTKTAMKKTASVESLTEEEVNNLVDTVVEAIVDELEASLKEADEIAEEELKKIYIKEGNLDMKTVLEDAGIMYTFLETLYTTEMADEEYINELVNKYNWSRVSSNILDILKVK